MPWKIPPTYAGTDRYVVTSLTGYPITPDMHSLDTDGKKRTEWYVLDTAYCYQIVASFKSTKGMFGRNGALKAHKLAHMLNLDERRWSNGAA